MKDRKPETAEMAEMDKAFEDFSKACDNAIGKCQDFIDMDINKTTEPTHETQRDEGADAHISHRATMGKSAYELWYLGDIYDRGVKNRETFNSFLIEAGSLMRQGIDAGLQIGGVEICEVNMDGRIVDSVWSMNIDEFKKVSR